MSAILSASVVVYRTPAAELTELLTSLSTSPAITRWCVVDNAAADYPADSQELRQLVETLGGLYVAALANLGFGAGHNLAIHSLGNNAAEFHVMLNPDILFAADALPRLLEAMQAHTQTVLLLPRVTYPDGAPQPLCKLLPTPFDFALRRFAPAWLQRLFANRLAQYELTGLPDDAPCNRVPFLSGCFMLTRTAALQQVGGFDERYFLYLEDVDLCRRLAKHGELLYWPHVTIIHGCARGAYRSQRLMFTFLRSAILYFNRWGWVFDSQRRRANRAALACLPSRRT